MILRGVKNLHRCAWIGEEDSAEDGEEAQNPTVGIGGISPLSAETVGGLEPLQPKVTANDTNEVILQGDDLQTGNPILTTSEERQHELEQLLRKAIRMSKDNKEILRLLHLLQRSDDRELPPHLQRQLGIIPEGNRDGSAIGTARDPTDRERREIREISTTDDYGGAEVFDEGDKLKAGARLKAAPAEPSPVENLIGGQVFFPEGLRFERGKFNQTNKNDRSNEEYVSSYSSSEEALANCEGVIMTLPLAAYRGCSFRWTDRNRIVYDIPRTGTYYFVFSSDNEISDNILFFNLTLQRVTYDTKAATRLCANTSECSLPLSFWSKEQTLVEVPEENSWSNSYVLDTACQPRVPVFFAFILAAPLLILLCAFQ